MKLKLLLLIAVITLLLTGCSLFGGGDSQDETPTPAPTEEPADESAATDNTNGSASRTKEPVGLSVLADVVVRSAHPAVDLAFETNGTIESIHVQSGEWIEKGTPIASLDDTVAQSQMEQALLNLYRDTLALKDLTQGADQSELASAQSNLATAQASLRQLTDPNEQDLIVARQRLQSSQQALQDLLDKPDPDQIQVAKASLAAAEVQLQRAQNAYDEVAWRSDAGLTPESANLQDATVEYERALGEYNISMRGASDSEIANATAEVAQAQASLNSLVGPDPDELLAAEAKVEQAQASLDELLNGASAKDLGSAQATVELSRLSVEEAQRQLDKVTLRAPASGTVTELLVSPGAQVSGGTPIATLLDTQQLEVYTTNLSERDLGQVVSGQGASVTLKAYPTESIDATVLRIGSQAGSEVVGDAATFPVVLTLGETELDIRPGMTGRVEIFSAE